MPKVKKTKPKPVATQPASTVDDLMEMLGAKPATPVLAPATERPICLQCHVRYVNSMEASGVCFTCWERANFPAPVVEQPAPEAPQEPQRLAKVLNWDKELGCGLVWLRDRGAKVPYSDVYSVVKEGANVLRFSKLEALRASVSVALAYVVVMNAKREAGSCNCKGNKGHGKCKHLSAALALTKAGKLA